MLTYLIVTGLIFALITLAHFARMYLEPTGHATDPWFPLLTALTLALSVWAFRLLKRAPRR